MANLLEKIEAMTPEQREGALMMLDEVSRPMTVREVEAALIGRGVSRTHRKILSKAVERFHIIAVIGGEDG